MDTGDPIEVGLALSGGGYRAMLFGLGSAWRLADMGWLRRLDIVTSVSGGSILNGVLATRWPRLLWSSDTNDAVCLNFREEIAKPVMRMAGKGIDIAAGLQGLVSFNERISDRVAAAYDEHLFHGARLQSHVPEFDKGRVPRFLFYATSLQTGSSVRIERKRLADYRIGEVANPDIAVAQVVAASSAFPPALSPVQIDLPPERWKRLEGADLYPEEELRRRMMLTDGGVYDNMGLEAIWQRCSTVLVCDAGAPLDVQVSPAREWTGQLRRVLDIVTEQTRALRRRRLMEDLQAAAAQADAGATASSRGTYWGVRTRIDAYGVPSPLTNDCKATSCLQHVRTRLDRFSASEQGELINWGYALADAAMRRWVSPQAHPPSAWPLPEFAFPKPEAATTKGVDHAYGDT